MSRKRKYERSPETREEVLASIEDLREQLKRMVEERNCPRTRRALVRRYEALALGVCEYADMLEAIVRNDYEWLARSYVTQLRMNIIFRCKLDRHSWKERACNTPSASDGGEVKAAGAEADQLTLADIPSKR
jgi:hypothetical protein